MAAEPALVDVVVSAVMAVIFAGWSVWLHRAWLGGWREIHRERRTDRRCAHRLTTTTRRTR